MNIKTTIIIQMSRWFLTLIVPSLSAAVQSLSESPEELVHIPPPIDVLDSTDAP